MPVNEVAENVLGTIGTVLWTGQVIPQVWKSYREKTTHGLSPWLMFIWATSAVFLGVYAIVQNINIPIILQPQLFGALAAMSWVQCLYYEGKYSRTFCVLLYLFYLGVYGGFEAGMSVVTRRALESGNPRPLQFFGVFSGILVVLGPIPQYIEIYKLREVRGISMRFMAIDISGGVFSTLSLVFKKDFDGIASFTYIAVIVRRPLACHADLPTRRLEILDGIIVVSALILNPRARRRREREALQDGARDIEAPSGNGSTDGHTEESATEVGDRLEKLETGAVSVVVPHSRQDQQGAVDATEKEPKEFQDPAGDAKR